MIHMFFYMYNCKREDGYDFLIMPKSIVITQDDNGTLRKKGESKYIINEKLLEKERESLSGYKDVIVFLAVTGTPAIANRKNWTNTVGFDIPLV